MRQKRCLNERRLTRRQVSDLIARGAKLRADLMRSFETTYASGYVNRPLVYELDGDRFLFVFAETDVSLPGKGDIYPGDFFRRWAQWNERFRNDKLLHGSSVSHWYHFSKLRGRLVSHIAPLVTELSKTIGASVTLDFTYASLDLVSRHVEEVGLDRACETLYDHLVAYVGEVVRRRTKGIWTIDEASSELYPYVVADRHAPIMPINVVWGELIGHERVDLRRAAANEVRSARARGL
jgi:hypothetical protein